MSKWSDDFESQFKDIKAVRNATVEVIKKGGNIAFKQYHSAKSIENIKKALKGGMK